MLSTDKTLKEARAFLEKRQFLRAIEMAKKISNQKQNHEDNVKESLRIQLYAYNRMQWVVDAYQISVQLQKNNNLTSNELLELALFNVLLGAISRARAYFIQGLKINSKDALLYSELAITYEQEGNSSKALSMYEKIILRAMKVNHTADVNIRTFSRIANLRILTDTEILYLQKLFNKYKEDELGTRIAFLLARAMRKLNDIESEIEWLKVANVMSSIDDEKIGLVWSAAKEQRRTNLIRKVFNQAKPPWMPDLRKCDIPYVFVLGMPRSGTTLLEQILGAHTKINNTGESRAFEVALSKANRSLGPLAESGEFPFIENVKKFSPEVFHSIISNYQQYQNMFEASGRLTDKALTNINWVGLLANCFPASQFIYIERDSLDNCTSLLQHDFGNSPYASNPEFCVLEHHQYKQRALHWKKLYPDRFVCITYEALVQEPQLQVSELVDFLNLNWETELLDFYLRKNSVRTPSLGQVRKSINVNQVGKWRKYQVLLGPAIESLNRLK